MPELYTLTVVVPAELGDEVVDTLISYEHVSEFDLIKVAGYSRDHGSFTVREQVEGYREMLRFEIVHKAKWRPSIMALLQHICGPSECRYSVSALLEYGYFESE